MTFRREPTYLTSEVWRACWLISKVRSEKVDAQGLTRATSPDEIAVELLRAVLKEKYPQLLEHQKAVEKMESELLKTLK